MLWKRNPFVIRACGVTHCCCGSFVSVRTGNLRLVFWHITLYRGWQTSWWPAHLKHVKIADFWHRLCRLTAWKHCLVPRGQESSCSCELVNDSWIQAGCRAFPLARMTQSQQSLADAFSISKCQSNGFSVILVWLQIFRGTQFSYRGMSFRVPDP